jgi:hypothetical protein
MRFQVSVASRGAVGLDNSPLRRYALISIPVGPLSQDMISLGGFFIGGKA